MIVASVHCTFAPNDAQKAEEMLRELRDASLKEPGVIRYELARGQERPNVFALWEVYRDKEAADAHVASEHFQRIFVQGLQPLVQASDIQMLGPI